jgi:hypothetical protein
MEEDILNFVAITSADPQKAAQYLRLSDNNLEQAIQLYFDSPNLDVGGVGGGEHGAGQSSRPQASSAQDPIQIDSDEEMSDFEPNVSTEDDEAMARRLQEEMYGGQGPEGDVRAPMARTTETLVGPGADYDQQDLDDLVAQQMAARRRAAGQYPLKSTIQMELT